MKLNAYEIARYVVEEVSEKCEASNATSLLIMARELCRIQNAPAPQSAREVAGTILDGIIRRIDLFFVSKDMQGAVTEGDDAFSPNDANEISRAIEAYAESRVQEAMSHDYCLWIEIDSDTWESECSKNCFTFNDRGPIENKFKYCPYCGKELKENKPTKQERKL